MLQTQHSYNTCFQPAHPFSEYFGYRYAIDRKKAIEEGFLVDVTELAQSIFNVSVTMTRSVFEFIESINYQDEFAKQWRIRSILIQARVAAKQANPEAKSAAFDIKAFPVQNSCRIRLWIQVEMDQNRPALTIMTDYEHCLLEVLA